MGTAYSWDFVNTSQLYGTLTFAPGVTQRTFDIDIQRDAAVEADETFSLSLYSPSYAQLGAPNALGVTILDISDTFPTVQFSAATASVNEDDRLTVTVTLSEPSSDTVTVSYTNTMGTAYSWDFANTSQLYGTLTFAPGVTQRTFDIDIQRDAAVETDETFSLTLYNPSYAQLGTPDTLGVTILDISDTFPEVRFETASLSVDEGASLAVRVQLAEVSPDQVQVYYKYQLGTAEWSDLNTATASGWLVIPPGTLEATFTVQTQTDSTSDDETFQLELYNPTYARIGEPGIVDVTILDYDPREVSVQDVMVRETATTALVPVALVSPAHEVLQVNYTAVAGSAVAPDDFVATSGTLTFGVGETLKYIEVPIVYNAALEPEEQFQVVLSSPVNAVLGRSAATITIVDWNDAAELDVPGDQLSTAYPMNLTPGVLAPLQAQIGDGRYSYWDVDLVEVSLAAGQNLYVRLDTSSSALNGYVRLFDALGAELAAGNDAWFSYTAPVDGTYYVGISGETNTDYDPEVADSGSASIPKGAYTLTLGISAAALPPDIGVFGDASATIPLSTGDTPLDFGTLQRGEQRERVAVLKNTGGSPLSIDDISFPPGVSTTDDWQGLVLLPQAKEFLTLTFDANTLGAYSQDVVIDSNDPDESEFRFTITASVVAARTDAVNDTFTGAIAGVAKNLDVLANDLGSLLSIVGVTQPASGSVAIRPDQKQLLFTGAAGFDLATFQYTVSDGYVSDTATVTVQANLAPVAVDDIVKDVEAGVRMFLYPLDNDSDPDGDALTIVSVGGTPAGTVTRSDGYLAYEAPTGFAGDTFQYTIQDAAGHQSTATVTLAAPPGPRPLLDVDFERLTDVTTAVGVTYRWTSYHDAPDFLYAHVDLANVSTYSVRGPILLGIKDLDNPAVTVRDLDGISPGGMPYYNITDRLVSDTDVFFSPGDSAQVELKFHTPARTRFHYELVVLGVLNDAPRFQTEADTEAVAGTIYQYNADAPDPDRDPVTYSLVSGPAGMTVFAASGLVRWSTAGGDRGDHTVVIRATDPYGAYEDQPYTLHVVDSANRPPRFTSTPVTDAEVGVPYQYPLAALDPDLDPLTFSLSGDYPSGMAVADASRGLIAWTPPAELVGQTVSVTAQVVDGRGGEALQVFDIYIHPQDGNHPPIIVSEPEKRLILPTLDANSALGDVAPGTIDLALTAGQTQTLTVSIALPDDAIVVSAADVFLLFDDTGSFTNTAPAVTAAFPELIADLGTAFPNVDFAFGVGRFEEYAGLYGEDSVGRPYILNQPILTTGTSGFTAAISSALDRSAPGGGGDGPETAIEALYQVATGLGFDGNQDGDAIDSGPAGIGPTQTDPGSSGDVPPFASYFADPTIGTLPASGSLGGVGFRPGALPIIILATDIGTAYRPSDPQPEIITGRNGVTVPLAEFQGFYRDEAPPGGAEIQETVKALNDLGALVIGLGRDWGNPDPRQFLEALAKLTGAVNESPQTIDSGIPGDPIEPGDPLYFDIYGQGDPAAGIGAAIRAALINSSFALNVEGTEPGIVTNLTGIQYDAISGTTATFEIQVTGDGQAHSLDLHFLNIATVLGSIPLTIRVPYQYDVDALDADDDPLEYSLVGETHGATIDPHTGLLQWAPQASGDYQFTAQVIDGRGGSDLQPWKVSVLDPSEVNANPVFEAVAPLTWEADREYSLSVSATDADDEPVRYQLVDDPAGNAALPDGVTIDPLTGMLRWRPEPGQVGSHSVKVRANDGRGGSGTITLAIDVVLPAGYINQQPEITSTPPAAVAVDEIYRYDVTATDPDMDRLSFDLAYAPAGMAIDADSGRIAWRPTSEQVGTHPVYVRVTDSRGGMDLQIYDLVVTSTNDPPAFRSTPLTTAATGQPYVYAAQATDPNGDVLTYTLDPASRARGLTIAASTGQINWANPAAGDHLVTVTVSDGRGGQDVQIYFLTVDPNSPPLISSNPPSPAIINQAYAYPIAYSDPNPGDTLTPSLDQASLDRGLEIVVNASVSPATWTLQWTPKLLGKFPVAITATDQAGASFTQSFTLPVIAQTMPSEPPRISSTPTGPAYQGQQWSYLIKASDPDGDDNLLEYFVVSHDLNNPLWEHITLTEKTLRWTPKSGEVPEGLIFKVRVTDTDGAYAEQTFEVPAQADVPPNASPRFTSVPTGPAVVGQTYRYQANAVDPDGDALTYGIDTATQALGADIDPATGLLTWQPTTAGNTDLVVTVTDGVNGLITQTFTLPVVRQNTAPAITSVPAGPAQVQSAWTYVVRATDSDPGDQALLQYRLTSPTEQAGIIEFDEASGTLTWTAGAAGSQPFTIEVDDTRGGVATQTFTIGAQVPAGTGNAPAITSSPQGPAYVGRVWTYLATATDADGDPISWTVASAPAGLTHETFADKLRLTWTPTVGDLAAAPHSITLQADDGDPLSGYATQSFQLGVVDVNQPPTITSLPTGPAYKDVAWSYAVTASDTDDPPQNRTYALDPASQIPTNAIGSSTGLITWTGTVPGSYAVIVKVSDGRGGEATQRFTLKVVDQAVPSNLPPVIRSLPPNSVRQGDVYSYALDAYDPNGDALQYQLTTAPSGMTVDASGVLRWRAGMIGDYAVTVSVSDGVNAPVEQHFPLEVLPPVAANEPPAIVSNPTGPAVRDRQWTYEVIGEDPNGDAITFSVTATDSGGDPVAMNIIPSATHPATQAVITWTPTAGGNVDVVVTATDGQRSSSQSFTLRVLDNAPPVIDSTPTQTVNLRALHQYTVHATDPNTTDVVRYAMQDLRQLVAIGGLQPTSTPGVVASTGQLTWTPDAPGLYEVTVSADDQRGGTDTQTYHLQVIDPNSNNPPLVDFAPRREVPFGVAMIYQVPASDPEGDPLTFTPVLSSLPPGMNLSPTGLLTWTPTAEQLSPPEYTVSLSVSDGENIVPVQSQLTVVQQLQNQPPEFTSTASTSAIANYRYTYDAAAVDPDGDSVVFSLAGPGSPDPAPAGMTIDSLTGLIQWRPTVSQVGSHTFTVVASDTLGLRDEQVVTLTVAGANRPPVIESDPPVIAVRNELYDYTIRASDPDGHRLTYSLAPNSEISASDPNVDFDPTTGRLQWTPDALGVFYVQINVVDEFGMGVGQGYRVQVLATAPNAAPRITSSIPEPLMAEVGKTFALTVTADDPNAGDTVSISMVEPSTLPGSGTFTRSDGNPASGVLAWTPATVGLVWFQFQASDGQATASQRFAILVTPANHPPTVEAIDNQTVTEGAELQVDVNATDADGDSLEYALDAASLDRGLTIDEFGRIRWQTDPGDTDQFDVIVSVTDNRIAAPLETTFRVSVVADNTGPRVTILPDRTAAEIGETVAILVHAIDDVAVAAGSKTLTLVSVTQGGVTTPLNQALALDAAGRAQLTLTAAHLGELRFEATAKDVNGKLSPTASVSVFVADPTNVAAPTAVIALPTDGQAVTEPVDVVGTVADDVAIRDWQLTYTPLDGGQGGLIAEGTGTIDNGVLGRFDPTILRNGMYRLDLVVTDTGNNTSSDSVTVEVEGNLKLGNFTLSFVDLEVPVAGLPLTITRTYDTLDAEIQGDFGYGWRLDLSNTKVSVDFGDGTQGGGLFGHRPFEDGTRVVITLPDGSQQGFTFAPEQQSFGFGFTADYVPRFLPDYGVTSDLIVEPYYLRKLSYNTYIDMSTGRDYTPADPVLGGAYTLKLRNGTELAINAETGELSTITDLSGNTLTFTGMGIEHSAGRSVQFERDFRGRITALIDPAGHRIEYAYDAAGDLVSMTDRVDATTTFRYLTGADAPEHYLDEIIDPLGRSAARTEYDEQGRVKRVTDADGKTIEYQWNGESKIQHITDQLGNTSIVQTDAHGNVVREENPEGGIALRTYDAKDRVLTETTVVGLIDSLDNGETNDLTTRYRYDEQTGDLLETIHPRGTSTATHYNGHGQPTTTFDELQNPTTNVYDERGLLSATYAPALDANGQRTSVVTRMDYDPKGNLTKVYNDAGILLVNSTYNQYGDVTSTTSAAGRTTSFAYDINGDQVGTWYFDTSTGGSVQVLDVTHYDGNRRVVESGRLELSAGQYITDASAIEAVQFDAAPYQDFVLWSSGTDYNAAGQVTSSTDRNKDVTENTYDLRGQQIQTRSETRSVSEGTQYLVSRTVYDAAGRAVATTDQYVEGTTEPIGGTITTYDGAGRVIQTERVKGIVIDLIGTGALVTSVLTSRGTTVSTSRTDYDNAGRVVSSFDQYGNESRTTYNRYGEVVQTATQARRASEGGGTEVVWLVSRTVYDDYGRVEVATDRYVLDSTATVYGTKTIYDTLGRVVKTERLEGVQIDVIDPATGNPVDPLDPAYSGPSTLSSNLSTSGSVLSATETVYNAKGQVARSIAADGQVTQYEYDSLGRQVATIGHIVRADSVALPESVLSALGSPLTAFHVRLRSETEYDDQGRVAEQRTNLVEVVGENGDRLPGYPAPLNAAAQRTSYEYDEFGNRVKTTYGVGTPVESFVLVHYDKFGRQEAETQQTDTLYLADWNVDADSFVVTGWDADADGQPDATQPLGSLAVGAPLPTKFFEYDASGRLSAVVLPAVAHWQTGQLVRPRYEYGYDANGNQTLIRDNVAQGTDGTIAYDHETGVGYEGADVRETRFTFDAQGRQLTRTLPLGMPSFDPNASGMGVLDASGHIPTAFMPQPFTEYFWYNDLGQQVYHVSFEGVVTEFQYDTDSGGTGRLEETRFFQNLADYRTWVAEPATQNPAEVWVYSYDAFGRQTEVVVSRRDANQMVVHRTEETDYDAQGRVVAETGPEGVVHYVFDTVTGRHTETWTGSGTDATAATTHTMYVYDTLGRLDEVRAVRRNGQVVDASTDAGNQPDVTDYFYDLLGNLDQVRQRFTRVIADYDYDQLNRLELLRHFEDADKDRVWDAGEPLLAEFDYDLLADGRRRGVTETDSQGYTTRVDWFYDAVGRLTREVYDDPVINNDPLTEDDFATDYRFDLVGNRREKLTDTAPAAAAFTAYRDGGNLTPDQAIKYAYDDNDRLLTELAQSIAADGARTTDQTTWHEYDPDTDGQPGTGGSWTMETRKTVFQGANTSEGRVIVSDAKYSFNLQNRLAQAEIDTNGATSGGVETSQYEYNTSGIRVQKVEGTDKVLYLVDGNNPTGYAQVLEELNGAHQLQRAYTLGLDVISQAEAAGPVYHLLYDGHGSTRALLNGSGVIIGGQTFAYDAYGNAIGFNPALVLTTLLYSGEQFDQRLQMQYLRARYYDLATGRFNRVDPFFGNLRDPLSLHKYLYVHGDPISGTDPSGTMSLSSSLSSLRIGFSLGVRSRNMATLGAG